MWNTIQKTTEFLKTKFSFEPEIGIVLGTGFGGLVNEIEIVDAINYTDIPNFPTSTVKGHAGRLVLGKLGDKKVIAMQGRFHYYEGYSMNEIVFPIRVMKALGIQRLILSNASGGVNPDFEIGEIMIQTDHINLFPTNPLIGPNIEELGTRFPDMSEPYCKKTIAKAHEIAQRLNIKVATGIYAGLTGPNLETPAEYKFIRTIGADTVGMSTVPEVIAARHMGIPCFAVSIITDLGVEGKIVEVTHEDVQRAAEKVEPQVTKLIKELLRA